MKLIRLFLIALLLQPCPVCWGQGIAAVGQCENSESEKSLSTPACCTHFCHTQEQHQSQQHDPQHDCPCVCHVTDVVYAQTASSIHLRGITTPLSATLDVYCQSVQNTVAKKSNVSSSSVFITAPLRI
tara:strand:+ start:12498 stop:12881 length:384 start_codon:yes stop_codon:yes gene_type:complete